jgi:hypothetical protein
MQKGVTISADLMKLLGPQLAMQLSQGFDLVDSWEINPNLQDNIDQIQEQKAALQAQMNQLENRLQGLLLGMGGQKYDDATHAFTLSADNKQIVVLKQKEQTKTDTPTGGSGDSPSAEPGEDDEGSLEKGNTDNSAGTLEEEGGRVVPIDSDGAEGAGEEEQPGLPEAPEEGDETVEPKDVAKAEEEVVEEPDGEVDVPAEEKTGDWPTQD